MRGQPFGTPWREPGETLLSEAQRELGYWQTFEARKRAGITVSANEALRLAKSWGLAGIPGERRTPCQ